MESSIKGTCDWPARHQILTDYHDTEWGVPVHDDRLLFEFLPLCNPWAWSTTTWYIVSGTMNA